MGKTVVFVWVHAHIGRVGNERADRMAKEVVQRSVVELNICLAIGEEKGTIKKVTTIRVWVGGSRWFSAG